MNMTNRIIPMMNSFVNLIPHDVIVDDGVWRKTFLTNAREQVRIETKKTPHREIAGVECYTEKPIILSGIPEKKDGVIIIVSKEVFYQLPDDRTDCVTPDTSSAKLNKLGHIDSVRGFICKEGA